LEVLRVVVAGAVTVNPFAGAVKVTTMVEDPARAVTGFTRMLADAPGPEAVLHVRVTGLVAVSKLLACMVPAPVVSASRATNAPAPRIFDIDKSNGGPSFLLRFSTTSRGGGPLRVAKNHIG
jgi:hypothetical protein